MRETLYNVHKRPFYERAKLSRCTSLRETILSLSLYQFTLDPLFRLSANPLAFAVSIDYAKIIRSLEFIVREERVDSTGKVVYK